MQTSATPTGLARYVPILAWLPAYERGWLRFDLLAGVTAAAVVIPQAMAYATIAGLPPEAGLYTCLVPMLVYALLGTSRPLSVSTTSTISIIAGTVLGSTVQSDNPYDFLAPAAALALLAGLFLVLASLLRLGVIANFISLPVLTGFKAGIGVVIFVGQLGKVLGLSIEKGPVFQTILTVLRNIGDIHWPTFLLALVTLAILIFVPRFAPRLSAPLVAVLFGVLVSPLLNLEAMGVKLIGPIPSGLPSFAAPDLTLVSNLWPGALGIALMSFTESIASARTFLRREDAVPDADQELLALGMANLGGSFFQAYPAGGGTSQTAVNDQAGAKSQLAQLVTVGIVVITLLFLAPLISLMPAATLGALVLVAAAGLVKVGEFQAIRRIRTNEFAWALVAFAGVMVLGTLKGILVAVIISMLDIIYRANHPPVYVVGRLSGTDVFRPREDHPGDEVFHGILLLRMEGILYFASAPRAIDRIWALVQQEQPKVVVLDCSAVPNIEYTALKQLDEFEQKLRSAGVILALAALNREALTIVEESSLGQTLGHERMFFNLTHALEHYGV